MAHDGTERTGVLVVRAWLEQDHRFLRARITARLDVKVNEETSVAVVGADAVTAIVHDWLEAFECGDDPVTGP